MFASIDQPGVGTILAPGSPLDFEVTERVPPLAAPRLGEHTEEVLAELLGIDGAQYGELHERGVVGSGPIR